MEKDASLNPRRLVSAQNSKRVLVVAYYAPPAGGPAVQRVLQFLQHLTDHGWQPALLTVREGAYPNRDASLLEKMPPSVEGRRTASLDPLALYQRLRRALGMGEGGLPAGSLGEGASSFFGDFFEKAARWVRANLFVPDARVGWWPFAVHAGRQWLREAEAAGRPFDAILSTGAPHSVHLAGRSLHRASGTPWVADLHDPWTDISYYDEFPHTAPARRLDAHFERSVLEEATAVTTVSPSWKGLFERKAPGMRGAVVENGFAEDDFATLGAPDPSGQEHFTIAHVGKLYASRNPEALWDALARLRRERAVPKLRVELTGTVDAAARRALAARGLDEIVEMRPFVEHAEALRRMARSALLFLAIEPFAQEAGMITSKLYEYLASGRPVLGWGPSAGDAAALLERTGGGRMLARRDTDGFARFLRMHYDAWAAGAALDGADSEAIRPLTRRAQAGRMAALLDGVVAGTSARGRARSVP